MREFGRNVKKLGSPFKFLLGPRYFQLLCFIVILNDSLLTSVNGQSPCTAELPRRPRDNSTDEDTYFTPGQLIKKYGYRYECHEAITKDGYILALFRIPGPKNGGNATKGPFLLMHGLLSSASDWLVLDSSRAFPYLLADEGYDVFIGNARGNLYTDHTILKKYDLKFWDFSFDQMGDKDVPAMIDKILNVTGAAKLTYAGHSMGTVMFFIAMSLRPEYNQKVNKMIAFGPAVYIKHISSPAKHLKNVRDEIMMAYSNGVSAGRVVEENLRELMTYADPSACATPGNDEMCKNSFFILVGYNPRDYNKTTTERVVGHTPSDASMKSLIHFTQYMRKGTFRQFDRGNPFDNILEYVDPDPPLYYLDRTTVPVLVVYGGNDSLCVPTDVVREIQELTNTKVMNISIDRWNHLDFTYADNAAVIYKQCINFLATGTI